MATIPVYSINSNGVASKDVIVDLEKLITSSSYGEEQWVLSVYAAEDTSISRIYITDGTAGWIRNSGLHIDSSESYVITDTSKSLAIKINSGSNFYTIQMTPGTYDGEGLSRHIQGLIRNLPYSPNWSSLDNSYLYAYKNCKALYRSGCFYIISGTISTSYSGNFKSSVSVASVAGDTCYFDLGFNLAISSETMSITKISESLISEDYTVGDSSISTYFNIGASTYDSVCITDGINTDYFTVIDVQGTTLYTPTQLNNGFNSIRNSYSKDITKIQLLKSQDTNQRPNTIYNTVDSIVTFGIDKIANKLVF